MTQPAQEVVISNPLRTPAPSVQALGGGAEDIDPDAFFRHREHVLVRREKHAHKLADNAALPQWSPDGLRIAYMGWNDRQEGPTTIRVVSPVGGPFREVTHAVAFQGRSRIVRSYRL